jgi:hypothetical protein
MRITQSFDPAQDRESFDLAQDREPVERPVERPFDASTLLSIDPERCGRVDFAQGHEIFEWQMGVFRQPQKLLLTI